MVGKRFTSRDTLKDKNWLIYQDAKVKGASFAEAAFSALTQDELDLYLKLFRLCAQRYIDYRRKYLAQLTRKK